MRTQMANLWKPREGISIIDKGEGLILFRFYHPLDMDLVLDGGPWTFDQNLLALHSLVPGDDLTQVPLHDVDFWILVYGLTAEFYSEVVGKALGNFLGSFVLYDETNQFIDQDSYMRIRVKLDVRKSLVREKIVKKPSSEVLVVFRYEKLPVFCFLCGRIGHIDRACEVRFLFPRNTVLPLLWDASLRAPMRRALREIPSPWLIPTLTERRIAIRRSGGTARGTLVRGEHQRPANIRALAPNSCLGMVRDTHLEATVTPTALTKEQPLQVMDDRKRQWGSVRQDSAMEIDKENLLAAVNNGTQGSPVWLRHGKEGEATAQP
ncbi:hypothetical protein LINGRAHAP2_LOCUS15161 [Linum grandiflorum]